MLRRLTLSLLLPFLVCSPLFGQEEVTKDQAKAAIKTFKKYFKSENEHVRGAAVDDLGEINHPDCLPLLIAAMKDKSDEVRSRVPGALAKHTTKKGHADLVRELSRKKSLDVQLAILESFKTTKPKVAYNTIMKLLENKTFELKFAAVEVVAEMASDGRVEKVLMGLLEDKSAQIRLVAIEALITLGHEDVVDTCLRLMVEDKDWRVKATCLQALRKFRKKRSIVPLIDMMEREEGRLSDDAHAALVDISGFDYSAKVETWRRWWKRVGAEFTPPSAADKKKAAERLRKARSAYEDAERTYTPYHGIKTKSRRMIFILDTSYSMIEKIPLNERNQAGLEDFRSRYGNVQLKVDLCRNELINVIAKLQPHVKFNIVLFDSEAKKWKKKLVSASRGNKGAAYKFLDDVNVDYIERRTAKEEKGRTNTFAALNIALGLKDEPQRKPDKNHTVESDTVFFMSDGMPTEGRIKQPDELLRYFKAVNKRAKIVFHTLTFGHGNVALLKPMAEWSGGEYVVIGVD